MSPWPDPQKQNKHQFLPMRVNMLLFLCSRFWLLRDFSDQWQINVLQARRSRDQCAVDCTTGSSYYCLYGGEKRPLGRPVFPVYWFYCSHPFVWVAECSSDRPSARQEQNSGVQPVLKNISFHSHMVKECKMWYKSPHQFKYALISLLFVWHL